MGLSKFVFMFSILTFYMNDEGKSQSWTSFPTTQKKNRFI